MARDTIITDTNLVIGRGLLQAEAIAAELRERIVKHAGRASMTSGELIELARKTLDEFEPLLARTLTDTELASWIAGISRVAERVPESLDALIRDEFLVSELLIGPGGSSVPPTATIIRVGAGDREPFLRFPVIEEARKTLLEREIVPREQFDALSDDFRRRAFTVAGESSLGALESIRDELAIAVDKGLTKRQFARNLETRLKTSKIGNAHLETIYRTNVQTAYNDGYASLANNPVVAAVFPFQEYLAIEDDRTRETHEAMTRLGIEGTNIYWRDDPVWEIWSPPNGFNCRCGVNLLTLRQAARRGLRVAREWQQSGVEPIHRFSNVRISPDEGFANSTQRVAL